ncbi:MAG TPA: DUF1963 domain-containing protein [Kofleriaceae bacterium]|nr:DUF1963 domain-containing protein [Kofleriaceae bacterium]
MNQDAIFQALERAGHGAHKAALAELIQPAYRIKATALAGRPGHFRNAADAPDLDPEKMAAFEAAMEKLPIGASRFGGVPDLPPGATWPEKDGVPMEFIAQLRLADVAAAGADERLPAQGSLLFFYNSQWGCSDMDRGTCCIVMFHDGADEALVRTAPPRVEWKSEFADVTQFAPFLHGIASLAFSREQRLPGGVSPYIKAPLTEFWQDFTCDQFAALSGAEEPYHQNFLLGYVDEQDYVDAHEHGTGDQLLLQVDSEDAAEFQFGDCNKLFFLLTKDELAARDFSSVRVYSLLG